MNTKNKQLTFPGLLQSLPLHYNKLNLNSAPDGINIYFTNNLQVRSVSNINNTEIGSPDFNKYVNVENSFIYH